MSQLSPAGAPETELGIEFFYTNTRGLGGRLRTEPEDFVVVERSDMPIEAPGHFTAAVITTRNWETNRLIRKMARQLRISRKGIMFCGTKDKRAITTQLFVIHTPRDNLLAMHLPDVEIKQAYTTHRRVNIGDLFGNDFEITLRDISPGGPEGKKIAGEAASQLEELGGFPNYFGIQRFGAVRPITHKIGRAIVEEDFERAVNSYLFDCPDAEGLEHESPETTEARRQLASEKDYAEALVYYPDHLGFEKAMLNHLAANSEDHLGALSQLPHNLLMMFIHAYQSYIFNRILSRRMAAGLPINEPVPGDFVLKIDRNGLPDHNAWVMATGDNIPKLATLCKKQKAFVSAALIGYESEFAKDEPGEIEQKVFAEENLEQRFFIIPKLEKMSSKGTRRELLAPIHDLHLEAPANEDADAIKLKFGLNKGCYATTLLREFMKSESLLVY